MCLYLSTWLWNLLCVMWNVPTGLNEFTKASHGENILEGFYLMFQTALGSVLQEPFLTFFFVFLYFITHDFLLKHTAKRKKKSKLQMNYAITFSFTVSLLSISIFRNYLSFPPFPPSFSFPHSKDKLSTSACIYWDVPQ